MEGEIESGSNAKMEYIHFRQTIMQTNNNDNLPHLS